MATFSKDGERVMFNAAGTASLQLLSEDAVLQELKLSKRDLAKMRRNGLVFVKLSGRHRAYFRHDVLLWALSRRAVAKRKDSLPSTLVN